VKLGIGQGPLEVFWTQQCVLA